MDFTAEEILARMRAELKNEDTKMEGSFSMDNLQAVSEELARFNAMRIVPLLNELEERESDMGTSGNERHYVQWAKEAENPAGEKIAGNAKVSSPRDGTGNVFIYIVTVGAAAPTREEIAMVQAYIDSKRPVGANPTVSAAESIAIRIEVSIRRDSGSTEELLKERMRKAIQEYFLSIAFQSGIISLNYYKIGNIISGVDGVRELAELTVNGGKESITADYDKYFSFEELIVDVIE